MRTAREIITLIGDSVRLWWRLFPTLGFWFCLGFLGRQLGLLGSIVLAANRMDQGAEISPTRLWTSRVAETLVFSFGLVIWLICLVMMIHSARGELRSMLGGQLEEVVPGAIAPATTRRQILAKTMMAFLAVFAVGGFAEEQIFALFQANLISFGDQADRFSVSLGQWWLYLAIAGGTGAIMLATRGTSVAIGLVRLFLKATTVLCSFLGLLGLLGVVGEWAASRRLWHWGQELWSGFLNALPRIDLWGGLELPTAVRLGGRMLWDTVLPGMIDQIAIPLLWLALTATVFGWHDFHFGIRASAREQSVLAKAGRFARPDQSGPLHLARRVLVRQAEDYLPTVQALRLVLRAGVRFAGPFLVVMALVSAAQTWLWHWSALIIGERDLQQAAFSSALEELIIELPTRTFWVAVLLAGFDRAVRLVAAQPGEVNPSPQTPSHSHQSSP